MKTRYKTQYKEKSTTSRPDVHLDSSTEPVKKKNAHDDDDEDNHVQTERGAIYKYIYIWWCFIFPIGYRAHFHHLHDSHERCVSCRLPRSSCSNVFYVRVHSRQARRRFWPLRALHGRPSQMHSNDRGTWVWECSANQACGLHAPAPLGRVTHRQSSDHFLIILLLVLLNILVRVKIYIYIYRCVCVCETRGFILLERELSTRLFRGHRWNFQLEYHEIQSIVIHNEHVEQLSNQVACGDEWVIFHIVPIITSIYLSIYIYIYIYI